MPYPRAHWYVLAVIAVIVAGFWPSYFRIWDNVPWQFHAHGVAASIWVMMVFPFLIGGLAAIIDVTGKGFVANDGPVRQLFGGEFLIGLAIAIAAYVTVYYRALKYRRKVWVHSGYMLSTPLILFESPFSRVMGMVVPAFHIEGPQHFDRIIPSILWAMAVSLVVIAAIWWTYRDRANPFLVAGGFIVAQMLTMGLMTDNAMLEAMLVMIGNTPSAVVVMAGFALGAATSWAGWQAGKRPVAPVVRVAQAA